MPTTREAILAALHARLLPIATLVLRDEVLPERVPASGLIILRDGQPGEPEVTLSRRTFAWLGRCLRMAKDWEKSIVSAQAWPLIAHIRRITRLQARS